MKMRQVNAEPPPVAWLRQTPMANVVIKIEMLVVHPVGEIEFQGYADELAPKCGIHVKTASDVLQNVLETKRLLPAARRGLENGYRRHVCRAVG
jgi:hypothetical protein